MYVGSHTWDGPEGVVDESYTGSSSIAVSRGWKPVSVRILEVVSGSRKLVAEREWILKYCKLFGVSSLVKYASKYSSSWCSKFRTDGLMINCHSNSLEHSLEAAHSKEVRKRVGMSMSKSLNYKEAHIKSSNTRKVNGIIPRPRWVRVFREEEFVFEGLLTKACEFIGNRGWNSSISQRFSRGENSVRHYEYLFVLCDDEDSQVKALLHNVKRGKPVILSVDGEICTEFRMACLLGVSRRKAKSLIQSNEDFFYYNSHVVRVVLR